MFTKISSYFWGGTNDVPTLSSEEKAADGDWVFIDKCDVLSENPDDDVATCNRDGGDENSANNSVAVIPQRAALVRGAQVVEKQLKYGAKIAKKLESSEKNKKYKKTQLDRSNKVRANHQPNHRRNNNAATHSGRSNKRETWRS